MVLDYLPASYHGNMDAREQIALRTVPGWYVLLQRTAWYRSLHGTQDRRRFLHRTIFRTDAPTPSNLPYVIKYNAKDPVAASRYAEIARRMGLDGTSERALINRPVQED